MIKGTIKQYDPKRGFGFIRFQSETGWEEVFFHQTALTLAGIKTIRPGEVVHFQIAQGERGPQAINLTMK